MVSGIIIIIFIFIFIIIIIIIIIELSGRHWFLNKKEGSPAHSKKAGIPPRAEPGTMQLHTTRPADWPTLEPDTQTCQQGSQFLAGVAPGLCCFQYGLTMLAG